MNALKIKVKKCLKINVKMRDEFGEKRLEEMKLNMNGKWWKMDNEKCKEMQ